MKIINSLCVIATLLFCGNVWADNCTIDKKIELAKAGYSKTEIDKMCDKPPECCCEYQTGGTMPFEVITQYRWVKADNCNRAYVTRGESDFIKKVAEEPRCTSPSYCGRSENSEFLPTSIHTSQSSKTSVLAKLFKEAKTQ
jgi:hypothetical protein